MRRRLSFHRRTWPTTKQHLRLRLFDIAPQVGQPRDACADELTAAAPNVTKIDFAFVKPVSLGNFVVSTRTDLGIQDVPEVGVAGVTVTLDGQLTYGRR